MGYTATSAGVALAPVGALAILLTPVVGKKLNTWDPRLMATGAFLVFAIVLWIRASFTTETDLAFILIPTILQGAALAFFFIPLTTVALAGLGPERIPAAAGLSNFVRITAGAMGTSIATTVWDQRASLHHAHFTEPLVQGQGAFGAFIESMRQAGLSTEQAWIQINRMIDQQAFTRAADDIFYASAWFFILLIAIIWIPDRPARYKPAPQRDQESQSGSSESAAASAAH